jgi:hypothetical protein
MEKRKAKLINSAARQLRSVATQEQGLGLLVECEITPADTTIVNYNFKSFQADKLKPRRCFFVFVLFLLILLAQFVKPRTIQYNITRAVESESEGILGGVGVGRNFRWSRSRKEF